MGQQSGLSVADSITSFKQLAGDTLTPGSVPYPEKGATGKKKKKKKKKKMMLMMMMMMMMMMMLMMMMMMMTMMMMMMMVTIMIMIMMVMMMMLMMMMMIVELIVKAEAKSFNTVANSSTRMVFFSCLYLLLLEGFQQKY